MARAKSKKHTKLPIGIVVILVIIAVAVFLFLYFKHPELLGLDKKNIDPAGNFTGETYTETLACQAEGEIDMHFLELGNKYTGDCTYIRVGNVDVLIDAGSKTSSIPVIEAFLKANMKDDRLDYVIVTHAHEDHYAGFATNETTDSLFDLFKVGTIIDFACTNQKDTAKMYNNYIRERDAEIEAGAVHYTARECIEQNKSVFNLSDKVKMTILDQKYYYEKASSGENDHSVCTMFSQGDAHYLFTGDLEEKGEESLVEKNQLPEVVLYKAGHHGSKTSSTSALMNVIKPKVVTVCCCAGSPEYTDTNANQFPTQAFVDRIAPYTKLVFVTSMCLDYKADDPKDQYTSMNGTIRVSVHNGKLEITCSNSAKILMEWDWFKNNRTTPPEWK